MAADLVRRAIAIDAMLYSVYESNSVTDAIGATLAAAILLDGEAPGLTRRAVVAALAGDMVAMKLCLEWVLRRHERRVTFSLPSLAAVGNGEN